MAFTEEDFRALMQLLRERPDCREALIRALFSDPFDRLRSKERREEPSAAEGEQSGASETQRPSEGTGDVERLRKEGER